MAIIRWNPSNDLFSLHSELDRVFNDMTEGLWPTLSNNGGRVFLPIDISRTDKGLQITASVPGFDPEDVSVTVDNGVLTIAAQRQQESEQEEGNYVRRERYSGRLFRQVNLGDGVDGDKAQATFSNGVLTITVPLIAKPEPKRIPVSAKK